MSGTGWKGEGRKGGDGVEAVCAGGGVQRVTVTKRHAGWRSKGWMMGCEGGRCAGKGRHR